MSIPVLFVLHDASATGVPMVLLRLLRALAGRPWPVDVEPHVLCLRDGELHDDLAAVAPLTVVGGAAARGPLDLLGLGLSEAGAGRAAGRLEHLRLRTRLPSWRWDVVHLNGAASFAALRHLPVDGVGVLGHVHELQVALDRSLAPQDRPLLAQADRYVAVTPGVAATLVREAGVAPDLVSCIGGFVDDDAPATVEEPAALRRRLGLPPGAVVVGAMGSVIPRKGPDLFVQLARRLRARGRDVHLVWVGDAAPHRRAEVLEDARAAGVEGHVHLVGAQEHPYDWHRCFDVLVVPSREDPMPLVALEAAQVGTPIVAFAQGGLPDLLGDAGERGLLAPPLDGPALAAAVEATLDDPGAARARAASARSWVQEHHVAATVVPALLAQIVALAPVSGRRASR